MSSTATGLTTQLRRHTQILRRLEVPFETVDILTDEMLRMGMKDYSQVRPACEV